MLTVVIHGKGTQYRVFQTDEATQDRRDITASYRLVDLVVDAPDGARLKGFFLGEPISRAENRSKSDAEILRDMRR